MRVKYALADGLFQMSGRMLQSDYTICLRMFPGWSLAAFSLWALKIHQRMKIWHVMGIKAGLRLIDRAAIILLNSGGGLRPSLRPTLRHLPIHVTTLLTGSMA